MPRKKTKRGKALWTQFSNNGAGTKPVSRRTLTARYLRHRRGFLKGKFCIAHEKLTINKVPATEVHHSRGRVSTLLNDQRFWMPVCADCHRWIHDNPKQARVFGLLCKEGEWNKPVKISDSVPDHNTAANVSSLVHSTPEPTGGSCRAS